ncbi:YgdI/YgdR family lipoprotein [Pantoea vagans]|uniref:YgdI/YgdR family lipoprotein n=1 Tax=Pantoea vagans TaxID=470934 RepID=UPI003FA3AB91
MTSFNYGKKFAFAFVMMASVMSMSACSGNYVISTNDGHMITTHGKPVRDKETGMLSYKDADGNMHQLQQHDVKEMVQK